ncbi:MAG: HPr family phosphocarrier protein [Elusimicrobiaceae bacterium]|nr:HPr family phosphocarrier protein [Elusimicrobiaceae bacterium]
MIQEKIKIKNKLGIHARPATLLAQEAGKFKSEIFIAKDGIEVNAKSIMGIMMIAAEQGSVLILTVKGDDEKDAAKAIKNIFNKIFEEE